VVAPTVALVRHASTAWSGRRYAGRSDPSLDAAGRAAAAALGRDFLDTIGPSGRIVSSPLRRALETAEAIAVATGAPITLDARWQEADVGAIEGLTFLDIAERWPDLARRLADGETDIDWPGGETAAAFEARVRAAWSAIADDDRPTVVVAHAGPLRLVLAIAAGRLPNELWLPEPASVVWVPAPPPAPLAEVAGSALSGPRATLGR
jgi:broad specificity phosphatase PhoE